ncbi:hypothetical protein ACFP3Q_01280 [Nocardioides sp. GCM10027113]|uniref:hypothetical protein n=1 Tax=unclassified Nocardioides TaxID=2615069 RepID=UPI0036191AAD
MAEAHRTPTTTGPAGTTKRAAGSRGAALGLAAAIALVLVAAIVPPLTGWDVNARSPRASASGELAPTHGFWDPRVGVGSVPAVLLALLGWRYAAAYAGRLAWRPLLLTAYGVALAWLLSLALVDGEAGISRVLAHGYEYLETAREVDDVRALLEGFVPRISPDHPDNWVTHVAGHPPGALLLFVGLVRVGLGGDLAAGLVVTGAAASVAPAVLVTLRALGAEAAARRAAPFLVLGPAAVFMAVSADAVFAAFAAWGLAALAVAATRSGRGAAVGWSVAAGLLLGSCVMLSYGLPLLGFLALAVLAVARSWRPLPVAAAAASAVVLAFAAAGFAWWEGLPAVHERYWRGLAADRPAAYWMWANLAALVVSAGPALGAGLGRLVELGRRAERSVLLLVAGAAAAVVVADLSRMSKAEVERIWLPFVPWLLLATALLPERWRRPLLALQVTVAVVMEHLLYTTW